MRMGMTRGGARAPLPRGRPCPGQSGFIYLMGRRTPIPQATSPRGFYIMQDVVRVKVDFAAAL